MAKAQTQAWDLNVEGVSVVVVGAFNPRIFHPQWFGRYNLLSPSEAARAEVSFVANDVAVFNLDGWLSFQVTSDKLVAESTDASKHLALRDIVAGAFDILSHTPVAAVGLNSNRHYIAPNQETRSALLARLAPSDGWSDVINNASVKSVNMEGNHASSAATHIGIKIEPSGKSPLAVFAQINQHFELLTDRQKDANALAEASEVVRVVSESWDTFQDYVKMASENLFPTGGN